MEESLHQRLFDLGARLGSLEGYLYAVPTVEKKYLAGWLKNIERSFTELSPEVRNRIAEDYVTVLDKVFRVLQRRCGEDDPDTLRAKTMLAGSRHPSP